MHGLICLGVFSRNLKLRLSCIAGVGWGGIGRSAAMLYLLSYQATWIDGQLQDRDISDDSEIHEYENMKIIYVNCG